MALEITGKLIQKLNEQGGTSKNGNAWKKQEFVIETEEQYPRKVCANLWGDNIDQLAQLNIGDTVKMSFNLESRSFNDRWYTDVRAWRLEKVADQVAAPMGMPEQPQAPTVAQFPGDPFTATAGDANDDLPF